MSKNIVSSPMDEMTEATVNFYKPDGKYELMVFMTNINIDELGAVVDNWEARTDEFTVESLVKYINSKSKYGFKAELIKEKGWTPFDAQKPDWSKVPKGMIVLQTPTYSKSGTTIGKKARCKVTQTFQFCDEQNIVITDWVTGFKK